MTSSIHSGHKAELRSSASSQELLLLATDNYSTQQLLLSLFIRHPEGGSQLAFRWTDLSPLQ